MDQRRIIQHKDLIEIKSLQNQLRFIDERTNRVEIRSKEVKLQYYVEKEIGEGCNGSVRLAHNIWSFEKFAVKTVKLEDTLDENGKEVDPECEVDNEIKIMQLACHENVLKLMNVIENPERVHLFFEFMDNGDLLNYIQNSQLQRLTETEGKFATMQVTRGLQHLHGLKISHLDLKLDNILVQTKRGDKVYKIGDFGFSLNAEEVTSECGTDVYYPPEIFVSVVEKHSGFKRDIWSLGICIYIILSGYFPFAKSLGCLQNQVRQGKLLFNESAWSSTSENPKKLIRSLCCFNPQDRLTCDEILEHKWFKDIKLMERMERIFNTKTKREEETNPVGSKKLRIR